MTPTGGNAADYTVVSGSNGTDGAIFVDVDDDGDLSAGDLVINMIGHATGTAFDNATDYIF